MRLVSLIVAVTLTACGSTPDMSRHEARDITRLAIVLGPRP
ncbi:hypothetical protein [Mesorhizobium sp. M2D.F.Ca.ET.232.01.1.1]|nr:hypothetical protein [Mesorhizobium sp. M2D.F.Ca.ET.232.01.1.1]